MILATPAGDAALWTASRQPTRAGWGAWDSDTFTDRKVTLETAGGVSAWHAATSLIGWGLGTLPLLTHDWTTGYPVEVRGGRVAPMLREAPNEDMSASVFWSLIANHLLNRSNAFLAKRWVKGDNLPAALYPIHPDRVFVFRDADGRKLFKVWSPSTGKHEVFDSRQILHVFAHPAGEGLMGQSLVSQMRERLGVAQSASEFQQRWYRNGTVSGGVLKAPPGVMTIPDERKKSLKKDWNSAHSGGVNAHGVVVLEGGWDYQPIGLSHADQQFIEQLNNAVSEIASWFHIPAAMLNGSQSGEPYNNAETHDLRVTKWAMQPWARWIEGCLNADTDLFGPLSPWSPEFDFDALYRTDAKTRAEVSDIGIRNSTVSPDEARLREGNAPRADKFGAMFTDQLMSEGVARFGVRPNADPVAPVGDSGGATARSTEAVEAELRSLRDAANQQPVNVHMPPVNVDVHVPEWQAPIVQVAAPQVHIDVPPAPVTVNVPEQAAPVVNVAPANVQVDVAAPAVTVHVPEEASTTKTVQFERDSDGNIIGAKVGESE